MKSINKSYDFSRAAVGIVPSSVRASRPGGLVSVFLAATCALAAAQDAWQPSDDFQLVSGLSSDGIDICFSAEGNLFAVGNGTTESGGAAVINMSTDVGTTWTTVCSFTPAGATSAGLSAV